MTNESRTIQKAGSLLAGYGIRYDASVLSSITKDGSNLVSQWNDISGNNHHLTQATSSAQPHYEATGLNNLPTIRFGDSDNEYMNASSMGLGLTPEIFMVCTFRAIPNTRGTFVTSYPNDYGYMIGPYLCQDTGCSRKITVGNAGGGRAVTTTMAYLTPYIIRVYFGTSGTADACQLQMNNHPTILFTHSGNTGTNYWNNLSIGLNQFETYRANVDFSEIIIYPDTVSLTDANREDIINYLNRKWKIF